jgi:hypothetical protein
VSLGSACDNNCVTLEGDEIGHAISVVFWRLVVEVKSPNFDEALPRILTAIKTGYR